MENYKYNYNSKNDKKIGNNFKIFFVLILFFTSFNFVFADPAVPAPPPPVTSYTYTLVDEFTSCGTGKTVQYCDDYYLRWKIVTSSGRITQSVQEYVCGKDTRCTNGVTCQISSPRDNGLWKTKTLTDNWQCPKGFGLSQIHQPGVLDPNFDTVSFSTFPPFKSNTNVDLYFNAFIPACVNRIPMMNFNPKLVKSDGTVASSKVGLYAKHETLSYDSNPLGGFLKNFQISDSNSFISRYNLVSDLKSYRMWSFRQRFVEGLQNTITAKGLYLPSSIPNVDLLDASKPHDYDEIYFSRDFMLGGFRVENQANAPVGEDMTQTLTTQCNFDVNELGNSGITQAPDLETSLSIPVTKSNIINKLNTDKSICSIDEDSTISEIVYLDSLTSYDITDSEKIISGVDIKSLNSNKWTDVKDFEKWAKKTRHYDDLTRYLIDENLLLNDNPKEDIKDINEITFETITLTENLIVNNYNENHSDDLEDYLINLDSKNYDDFSETMNSNGQLDDLFLIDSFDSFNKIDNNTLEVEFTVYTRKVNLDLELYSTVDYNGFANIELTLLHETTTESSWNWRSLESLTLAQLSRCLYHWDECLLNSKTESGVSWTMNEVADLGYGPIAGSLAYIWSKQSLESEYTDLTFGYHFDGARGLNSVDIPVTVYKSCEAGDKWISDEGYYSCYDSIVYKCHYLLSADEFLLGYMKSADVGNTVHFGSGNGYVCTGSDTDGYIWKEIGCFK